MVEGAVFRKEDFSVTPLAGGEFDNCTFIDCLFTHAVLSGLKFRDCTFRGCDLSLAALENTVLSSVTFSGCKLLGLNFSKCNQFLFSVAAEGCIARLTAFCNMKLKKIRFRNCELQEADFTGADLSGALFDECDLHRAIFMDSNLEMADFRTAFNYSIDPERNRMRKARFASRGLAGLLDRYNILVD